MAGRQAPRLVRPAGRLWRRCQTRPPMGRIKDNVAPMTTNSEQATATAPESAAPSIRFDELGLRPEIQRAVADQGYTTPTPIQAQAIPVVLAGRDLMAGAQTGTGKTAAFTLPLLQRLSHHANPSPSPARHPVRALILTPTRELAMQVQDNLQGYSQHLPFRTLVVYGGVDIKAQIAEIRKGVEFLVATPGRLLDLVEQKTLNFQSVEALVLDEADRMLDMGFIPDVQRIINLLPKARQSLLFSATFSDEIKRLAASMLQDPVTIQVAARNTVSETIAHVVHPVDAWDKRRLLIQLLKSGEISSCLVFVRTKIGCGRLSRELEKAGIAADAIHGDKSQNDRTKALEAFKAGTTKVLVATDVAARGIDIDELPYVVNYEIPHTPEDYVHRIGRTGRAGKQGKAISLVASDEVEYLVDIEKLIKRPIEQVNVPGFEPDEHWCYPPDKKGGRKRAAAPGERGERSERPGRGEHARPERGVRSEREGRGERPAGRSEGGRERTREDRPRRPRSLIAADGFDFSKPYEAKPDPNMPLAAPVDTQPHPHADPHKKKRPVAALLGGLGRKA
jgi:ATP-dependent RNA helicase RhlE